MKAKIPYKMSAYQRKAMLEEINRQVLEADDRYAKYFDAMVLWTLHVCFGFGQKRLKKFWDCFVQEHRRLRERYQLPPGEDGWLYLHMLKEHVGINIEEWYQEQEEKDEQRKAD